jgi:hypothetical protein
LHQHGRLVARSARPAGRIAALAFLKLHGLVLLSLRWEKTAARGRACAPRVMNAVHDCGGHEKARGGQPGLLAQFE